MNNVTAFRIANGGPEPIEEIPSGYNVAGVGIDPGDIHASSILTPRKSLQISVKPSRGVIVMMMMPLVVIVLVKHST